MKQDLLELLQEKRPRFSKGQRKIACYLLEHYDKAAFYTAFRLGKEVGVSESTVVRFAAELGFAGYPQLQSALYEQMQTHLTTVQRMQVAEGQLGESVLFQILQLDIDKIRSTLSELSEEDFTKAVDRIVAARKIYIMGTRSAAPLASFLYYYFNLMLEQVHLVDTTSSSEMFEQLLRINQDDLLIGISFPRYSKHTVQAFRYAKQSGAGIIGITDSEKSPLAGDAEVLLLAKSEMVSFLDSLVAPMSLLNALIVSVGIRKRVEILDTFCRLEQIWEEYGIYASVEGGNAK